MSALTEGDIVVLVSGSPRLCVEKIIGKEISCVWINEGSVHRDTFNVSLIRKWEASETGGYKGGAQKSGDRSSYSSGDRSSYNKGGGYKGGDRDKPRGKPYEGKGFDRPNKDKSFFRKD